MQPRRTATHPQRMDSRLRRVPVQPLAVRVPRQAVHDGPANAARAVDLQAQVVVRASDGVVVLVDDKVRAMTLAGAEFIQRGVGRDGEGRRRRLRDARGGEQRGEVGEVVGDARGARLDGRGGGLRFLGVAFWGGRGWGEEGPLEVALLDQGIGDEGWAGGAFDGPRGDGVAVPSRFRRAEAHGTWDGIPTHDRPRPWNADVDSGKTRLNPRLQTPCSHHPNRLLCARFHRTISARRFRPCRLSLGLHRRRLPSPSPIAVAHRRPPRTDVTPASVARSTAVGTRRLSQRGGAAIPSRPRAALHRAAPRRAACDNGLAA
ncbi:Uncharacterized protein TCAP_03629 [Tolypocladium capitatum]|uniref:Uncharacterized protein n=1 Tax=Tolypocladium capitatum TaxID=45235 RepID=A0A2K3QG10_9HYPO|nr:Uncharacterized protein TCAP_03629 [Tolypocladium capitatum]